MRRWLWMLVFVALLAVPSSAFAQSVNVLSSVNVQLWPEYDQPSMLVIVDFTVSNATPLPTSLEFHIPQSANLIAVAAYDSNGALINAPFDGPRPQGDRQAFTISLSMPNVPGASSTPVAATPHAQGRAYRFEYYQPLTFVSQARNFSYRWDGDYGVDAFTIRVLEALDTLSFDTVPSLPSAGDQNGLRYHESEPMQLASGEVFNLDLKYTKTTDSLVAPPSGVQPAAPVDENTPGRVSLNSALLYVIGGLILVFAVVLVIYFWQSAPSRAPRTRKRAPARAADDDERSGVYCGQCGTRAQRGDRFCRVCGARLRQRTD